MFFDKELAILKTEDVEKQTDNNVEIDMMNLIIESNQSWYNLREKIMKAEHYCIVNEETEMFQESISEGFAKIKNFFIVIGQKIKELVLRAINWFKGLLNTDENFLKKYEKLVAGKEGEFKFALETEYQDFMDLLRIDIKIGDRVDEERRNKIFITIDKFTEATKNYGPLQYYLHGHSLTTFSGAKGGKGTNHITGKDACMYLRNIKNVIKDLNEDLKDNAQTCRDAIQSAQHAAKITVGEMQKEYNFAIECYKRLSQAQMHAISQRIHITKAFASQLRYAIKAMAKPSKNDESPGHKPEKKDNNSKDSEDTNIDESMDLTISILDRF